MTDEQRAAVLKLYGLEKLEDATRETWPWWLDGNGYPDPSMYREYMPDFPNDDAAAVKLAERIFRVGIENIECIWGEEDEWLTGYQGPGNWGLEPVSAQPTLGSALLAALAEAT